MKYLGVAKIEEIAQKILAANSVEEFPVNLELLAQRLGIEIEYAPLGEEVSGVLVIDENEGQIGINKYHPEVRQRFTLAHEIGHFVLHRDSEDLFIDKRYTEVYRDKESSSGESRREIQANQFAAALLMPEKAVRSMIDRYKLDLADDTSIEELAETFGVSVQALIFRLSNLNIFSRQPS